MIKRALEYLRNLDLTAIGKSILAKWGFFASLVGGWILKFLEKIVDQKIKDAEDAIEIKEKDEVIAVERHKKAEAIENAKTDDEFDDAVRDSLK